MQLSDFGCALGHDREAKNVVHLLDFGHLAQQFDLVEKPLLKILVGFTKELARSKAHLAKVGILDAFEYQEA